MICYFGSKNDMKRLEKHYTFESSSPETVWKGLTDPELVRQYFFGTELVADWHVGGKIYFRGEWEGQPYEDKGEILELNPPFKLTYSYFSSFSELEDLPENYNNISYIVEPENGGSKLTILQDGISNEDALNDSAQNWDMVIKGLQDILKQ